MHNNNSTLTPLYIWLFRHKVYQKNANYYLVTLHKQICDKIFGKWFRDHLSLCQQNENDMKQLLEKLADETVFGIGVTAMVVGYCAFCILRMYHII